jgi:hypothetical protein
VVQITIVGGYRGLECPEGSRCCRGLMAGECCVVALNDGCPEADVVEGLIIDAESLV